MTPISMPTSPQSAGAARDAKLSRSKRVLKVGFTLCFFLLPAFLGFGNKFREFLLLAGNEEGAFALMPVMNYLLASLGFFFLLCWATMQGMFHDIEKPKETLLANERFLDEELMPERRI